MSTPPKRSALAIPTRHPVLAALALSAVFAVLYFVFALTLRGEQTDAALWQALFCFAGIAALMFTVHGFQKRSLPPGSTGEHG
ncbi:hypothetical protein LG943_13030 [Streptomonospora sp. S1-112]|uniref:Uncharacterized protein n=1 Tax=Streptomonospora mangrovi TaxID=2883123 RepID=A0A9X3NN84_9ACTN|nr:hypothetical protein [Streptomonospora mangrovi]MDA0565233.1 hypothetical protein [Streptomonospora mangrovi]